MKRFPGVVISMALAGIVIQGSVATAGAQSLTAGALHVAIVDGRNAPMADVTVTLEQGGKTARIFTTDHTGIVVLTVLEPGQYSVLAEQLGYQPVRMLGVPVVAGGLTSVTLRLMPRPPPITSVDEQPSNAVITGNSGGLATTGADLLRFTRQFDITDVTEAFSEADAPRDGRAGMVSSANGLPPRWSSLVVDGIREGLISHPGLPDEPATAPAFARDGAAQTQLSFFQTDAESPPALGAVLGAETPRGGERFVVRPWFDVSSAKLGGRSADNPDDSSATSFRGGLSMGGPIKGDTASWFLRGDYQRLELPGAAPFVTGLAGSDSGDVTAAIRTAATAMHQDVSRWLAPAVQTWKGGSAMGRLDWRFSANTILATRFGIASWNEDNPVAGSEPVNGAGAHLDARDMSGAASLTAGGTGWTSETRVGVHASKRDWTGATLPFTSLAGDGIAFGGAATLPGNFTDNGFGAWETITVRTGSHTFKGGGSIERRVVNYAWLPGGAGQYLFGDLASFAADEGAFYQAIRSAPTPDIGATYTAFFLEDSWQATPQIALFGGLRYDHDALPSGAIGFNLPWALASNLRNNLVPRDSGRSGAFGPRAGFAWTPSANGRTAIRGSIGVVPGHFDLVPLAEAAQYDGDVRVRRAVGSLTWPELGSSAGSDAGVALTMFNSSVRKPRAFKSELALTQQLDAATTLTVSGAYRHTDYLLRRDDLNRVPGAVNTGADGRPIFGSLQQFGGLIVPALGSNRRFPEFDMVYALSSTGYADYYEAGASVDRRLARGLSATLSYTYSRTTDNLPGALSANPADQLSPFPGGLNGTIWEDGRSDLDIPHRVAATVSYTSRGKSPFTLAARYRYRSGLPFTPGFRGGVDVNGDGSGGNDPAFLGSDAAIPGIGALVGANSCLAGQANQIAGRNSCRDPGVHSVDLHASITLPMGGAHPVALTVDGYNVAGSATGLYDHAAVLVDGSRSITFDQSGHVVLPLVANPDFGKLLSRRGIPRQIRVGFRVEE
ncbi:MAG: carboxypeptidase regulatory-like domain-containing protein [Gemmatimonadales bacterium]